MANDKSPRDGDGNNAPTKAEQEEQTCCGHCKVDDPVRTALSIYRKRGAWVLCVYTIQGDKVISALETIEDVKGVTWEKFRIAAVKHFIDLDK